MSSYTLYQGDCLDILPTLEAQSVHCVVTSPPYFGLRDYGHNKQIGLEETPEAFIEKLVQVFREVRRVLREDGTVWLNLGDSYNNFRVSTSGQSVHDRKINGKFEGRRPVDRELKEKDLIGIPWRVAFALQADGWWLRQDIIWSKPNPMPESVLDRCTKSHEYIFILSKSGQYYFDNKSIREEAGNNPVTVARNGRSDKGVCGAKAMHGTKWGQSGSGGFDRGESEKRNRRSVWTVAIRHFDGSHFATFPPALIEPCILAGCPVGGTVLDPFGGAGTTGLVALSLGRDAVLCELNPEYAEMARQRIDRGATTDWVDIVGQESDFDTLPLFQEAD